MSDPHERSVSSPSRALLSAALGALLWGAAPACAGSPGTSGGDAAFACDGGVSSNPSVTASSVVADLTLDRFTAQCDARSGVVELQPHCGGLNNCRGMSYDTGTQTLTEHTCRATNTCAGYTCVICDE